MREPHIASGFDDGKDPSALRTIGEVSRAVGIRQHVLRYWEEQFSGLNPIKRSGGRRYYRPEDVALIVEIDRLVHRDGYTLRGAAKAICEAVAAGSGTPEDNSNDSAVPAASAGEGSSRWRDRLVGIRDRLALSLAEA